MQRFAVPDEQVEDIQVSREWMRSAVLEELKRGLPCSSRATISPSRTKSPSINLSASTTFGKRALRTFLLRENSVTSEPRFTAIHRKPSNLISNLHLPSSGNAV